MWSVSPLADYLCPIWLIRDGLADMTNEWIANVDTDRIEVEATAGNPILI